MEQLLESEGRTAESYGLISPGLKGIENTKSQRRKKAAPKTKKTDIGDYQKNISEAVLIDSDNHYNLY
jgi:hypothetical protein